MYTIKNNQNTEQEQKMLLTKKREGGRGREKKGEGGRRRRKGGKWKRVRQQKLLDRMKIFKKEACAHDSLFLFSVLLIIHNVCGL